MIIRDGDWRLVDYEPISGRSVWRYDDGAQVHYRTDTPVGAIIEANKREFNHSAGEAFGQGKRVASIPLNLFYDQLHEAVNEGDDRYITRWLNDGDHRGFRCFEGSV